ncbi:GNAT family N-acetyltransferase [Pokkaliibacter sp. CJK22405]|uniref:GNAT family N-acetyltransferase n=1 Tax=Pokkaliibacter sp. CJK22405 TaxID=3384615 RepID=UPI003984CCCB
MNTEVAKETTNGTATAVQIAICQPARHQTGIAELIVPIQQQEFNIPITFEDQPDLRQIESFYQHGKGNFWVALDGDKVVGSIALLDIGNDQAALRKMFVHPEYRGRERGVAAALLATLIAWSREQQLEEIYLGTTSAFLAAHRFYEKHGFLRIEPEALPERFPVMQVDTCFYALSLAEGQD